MGTQAGRRRGPELPALRAGGERASVWGGTQGCSLWSVLGWTKAEEGVRKDGGNPSRTPPRLRYPVADLRAQDGGKKPPEAANLSCLPWVQPSICPTSHQSLVVLSIHFRGLRLDEAVVRTS